MLVLLTRMLVRTFSQLAILDSVAYQRDASQPGG
jgi:hypothetical protein